MKYLNVSETIQKALKREVQVMKNMNSPAIIKLYDSFQIDQYLFIVMEYSPLGDLETHIKKRSNGFGIDEVAHFMTELGVLLFYSVYLRPELILYSFNTSCWFASVTVQINSTSRLKASEHSAIPRPFSAIRNQVHIYFLYDFT
mgnify:CR=1 FL=1